MTNETTQPEEAAAVGESAVQCLVMLPEHPCYVGDGGYDHNWEFQDDSFGHEFGVEVVQYFRCSECATERDIEPGDYDDSIDSYF